EAGAFEHGSFDAPPNLKGRSEQGHGSGDVQKGFVEGERLDGVGELRKHPMYVPTDARVLLHVASHEDPLGTELPSTEARHGRINAEAARLVGSGGHDA